jgi:hypothetical protein
LTVPTGLAVLPIFSIKNQGGSNTIYVWSPAMGSAVPTGPTFVSNGTLTSMAVPANTMTNTAGQLYFQITTAGSLNVYTTGYIGPHVAPIF